MVPMFLSFEWSDWLFRSPYLNAVTVTGIALLMVSKLPTVSLKRIRVRHDWVMPTLLGIGILAALVTTFPWPTLTAIGIVYVGSIPLTIRFYSRLRRNAEMRRGEPAAAAALPLGPYSPDDETPPATQWKH
jgi:CDP-diacylglycerol--serine O-phosphatidyltransferase